MSTMTRENESSIREGIIGFIVSNFLFGDESRLPKDPESLIELGIIDSTGILELIEFTEERYGIVIEQTETVPENLGSIANLVRFIKSKQA